MLGNWCRLVVGVVVASLTAVSFAAQEQSNPLADTVRELSACHSKLGALEGLQAQVVDGTFLNAKRLASANPDFSIDPVTLKITAKPKTEK